MTDPKEPRDEAGHDAAAGAGDEAGDASAQTTGWKLWLRRTVDWGLWVLVIGYFLLQGRASRGD